MSVKINNQENRRRKKKIQIGKLFFFSSKGGKGSLKLHICSNFRRCFIYYRHFHNLQRDRRRKKIIEESHQQKKIIFIEISACGRQ